MVTASSYELWHHARHAAIGAPSENRAALSIAFMVSTRTAFVVVKWLLSYIKSHRYTLFAWYRIVLGLVLFGLQQLGYVH